MNYIGFSKYDTANGPGVRVSLFVSGCTVHCKGCFNQESWDFAAGKPLAAVKTRFPEKTVWAWTGRVFDKVKASPLLGYIDVLVDGPFVEKKKVTEQGLWYGSTNQRVLKIVPDAAGCRAEPTAA